MLTYGCLGKYVKKLAGRTGLEDALGRLDRLTHDEVGMGVAQGLRATHGVDDRVRDVDDKIDLIIDGMQCILNQPRHNTQFYPIRQ
jgi:hypothetical protein